MILYFTFPLLFLVLRLCLIILFHVVDADHKNPSIKQNIQWKKKRLMFVDIVETHSGYEYYVCNPNRSLVSLKLFVEGAISILGFRGFDAKSWKITQILVFGLWRIVTSFDVEESSCWEVNILDNSFNRMETIPIKYSCKTLSEKLSYINECLAVWKVLKHIYSNETQKDQCCKNC